MKREVYLRPDGDKERYHNWYGRCPKCDVMYNFGRA